MATRTIANAGGNWSATGTWVEGSVPTASDDVVATGTSGNLTIDVAAVCRSIDLTGYVAALTHNAFTLTVGTSTAQGSLVALAFPSSGWTYTLVNALTSAISLTSTAASTIQTVDFGGKTTGNTTFSASTTAGGYQLINNGFTTAATATVTLLAGSLDVNGLTCSWGIFNSSNATTRTLKLATSTITVTGVGTSWNVVNAVGFTLPSNTATVILTGAAAAFSSGGVNWNGLSVQMNGSGTMAISGGTNSFGNLTRTGTATKTDSLNLAFAVTVTGTLTLAGNSITNRLLINSLIVGAAKIITVNGSITASNVDFQDITGAGTASWNLGTITGGSGDALGNSGITFTTAAAQTWAGTSSGNWSTNAWTSRVPLPQDDVTIASAFSASQTVTADMPRIGHSITWTGATGAPAWAIGIACTVYGNVTLATGMTMTGAPGLNLSGRSSNTLTSNGVAMPLTVIGGCAAVSYTLTDNASFSTNFQITGGTVTFNANVTVGLAVTFTNSGVARTINMGSSVWTFTTTTAATVWNVIPVAGVTLNSGTSTLTISTASASARTFAGGGLVYNNLIYSVGSSTGALIITGSNTFGALTIGSNRTLTLTNGTTTTIGTAAGWQVNGTAGNLVTINSALAGSQATLSCATGTISSDYLSIKDSAATGGASWYAGNNSTSVSNNSGWLFAAPVLGLEYWGRPI